MSQRGGAPKLGPGLPPGMGMMPPGQDKMARALMAAITEAAKGGCECNVCKLMRKVSSAMTADILEEEDDAGS